MVISTEAKATVGTCCAVCISCAVCGKVIPLNEYEVSFTTFRLCDECIKAIKFAKTLMKNNPNMNVDGDDGK